MLRETQGVSARLVAGTNTVGPGVRTVVVPRKAKGREMANARATTIAERTMTNVRQETLSPECVDADGAVKSADIIYSFPRQQAWLAAAMHGTPRLGT
jgi:hypothetical protein